MDRRTKVELIKAVRSGFNGHYGKLRLGLATAKWVVDRGGEERWRSVLGAMGLRASFPLFGEVVPRSREARAFRAAEGLSARNLEPKPRSSDGVLVGHDKEMDRLDDENKLWTIASRMI